MRRLSTLEVNETDLKDNSKIILTHPGVNSSLIIGDGQTKIIPVESKIQDKKEKRKFTKPERIGLGTRTPT